MVVPTFWRQKHSVFADAGIQLSGKDIILYLFAGYGCGNFVGEGVFEGERIAFLSDKILDQKLMRVKEIFNDLETKIFEVVDSNSDNELEWTIEPTNLELLPEEEGTFIVKAKQVFSTKTVDCFLGIDMPERIAETVFKLNLDETIIAESIHELSSSVIPSVASEGYGDFNLFYAKENPQVGIDILKSGLERASNKNVVAEDLGYILREEDRIEEAIDAFKISEQIGPTSEYIYLELSRLYKRLGKTEKQSEYELKFKEGGLVN